LAEIQISLAAARVNARMTQEEVAKKLNVGKSTIVSWEKGEREPKIGQAMTLSNIYKIPIDYIFLPNNPTLSEKTIAQCDIINQERR